MSLWNISDEGTAVIMKKALLRMQGGEAPEFALQGAMQEMKSTAAGGDFADPAIWAAFSLYGRASLQANN